MAGNTSFRTVALRTPHGLIASGFGSGLSPWAPGTVGSLAAMPLWLLLSHWPLWLYGLFLVLAFALGVWAADKTGQAVGETDHGGIVWDEFVGLWITLAVVPRHWPWILAGFVAFRFFDILKPPPVRQLERRIPGGLGVMLDDVAAGLYAAAVLLLARYLIGAN